MTRPATAHLDAQIISMLRAGLAPKEAAHKLKLRNKWRAYDACRRMKVSRRRKRISKK